MSRQQQETFSYFDSSAMEWRQKAEGKIEKVNIIEQRNACVLRVAEGLGPVRRVLDIGCGTGELVLEASSIGIDALGLDFAPKMIETCEAKKAETGAAQASFVCQSIFDFEAPKEPFDLISALGLIEYISADELVTLLKKCTRMLRPGGAFVVGSRNRLFNLFSLNEYTHMERKMGVTDALLDEATAIASAPDMTAAIDAARDASRDLPQPHQHPGTGIGVSVRYQYTPGGLGRILLDNGLRPARMFPIHYHALPTAAKGAYRSFHIATANLLNDVAAEDHRLIPQSSSFVLSALAV